MKTNRTFFAAVAVTAVVASMLCSCNPDVQLGTYEDAPKVAETLLGKTSAEATAYLQKLGFNFGNKADYADEYVFSKDASLKEFSYEASIMLMFGTYNDTVKYAGALQRMQTEKSARDLYWKWSHYTASVTLPKVYFWNGSIIVKDLTQSQQPDRWTTYHDGSSIKQMLAEREEDYKNGRITKEQYDSYVDTYTRRNRELFWTDYKREGDNIDSAYEEYRNKGEDYKPKEVGISLDMNNGGEIQLYYETRDFVVRWETSAANLP